MPIALHQLPDDIDALKSLLADQLVRNEQLTTENQRLTRQKDELDVQRAALVDQLENKQVVLLQLNRQLRETGKALEKRTADRRRLEQLLVRIEDRTAMIVESEDSTPFKGMKGQLLLPVNGRITQRFGAQRNAGKMRWRGVFIDAPEGEQVHAVHYGRVVFSDWLRGFGLLLIVNHGQGYMSLYGHNQMIYRETGDWVVAGEAIATVGDTGGQDRSGLYFEIRIDGNPADPQLWCQARRQKAA